MDTPGVICRRRPPPAPEVVGDPPAHLGGGHLRESPEAPFEFDRAHGPASSHPSWADRCERHSS